MKYLDYLFYRIFSFYDKKGDGAPILMGCLVLAVVLFATLLSCSFILEILLKTPPLRIGNYFIAGVILVLLFLMYFKYRKNQVIEKLATCYKDESLKRKRINGWLFISYLILVISIPILVGYMRHNLGMNI